MWQTGTSTDYLDLLSQLKQIATGRHVSAAAVNAGGTGYAVDDILSVAGGTSSHVAKIQVLTVDGSGVILTARIQVGGAYTADPTTTANAVTGGAGASATFDLTMTDTGWTQLRRSKKAASAVVAAGGTGYVVGNNLTLVGGLGIGVTDAVVAAVFQVATLSGSAVATVTLVSAGLYEELPANPVAVTGGAGSGATLTVTWADAGIANEVLILQGNAVGSPDGPIVAFKAYSTTNGANDVRNWALFGLGAFLSNTLLHNHATISPGFTISGGGATVTFDTTNGVPNVPLKVDGGGFPIKFWMSVNDRRITMVALVETAITISYVSMYVGFLGPFGTAAEIPHPLVVMGSATIVNTHYNNTSANPVITSIVQMISDSAAAANGPGQMLDPAGQWHQISSYTLNSSNTEAVKNNYCMYPFGEVLFPSQNLSRDAFIPNTTDKLEFKDLIEASNGIAPPLLLMATPDSVNAKRLMIPVSVLVSEGDLDADNRYPFGELDGVFWFSYAGGGVGAGPQDFIIIGTDYYRVFQTGFRTTLACDFFAVKEA